MKPKISIIVPIYKVESYLRKCIDSILNQTFTDFELILVNDGSPDNCGKICDEYANKDHRIIVIHKENGGVSSARNAGIEAANGQYIGFVDSDDYIHEKMYEILYENARLYHSDIAQCNFLKVDQSSDIESNVDMSNLRIKQYTNMDALHQLFSKESNEYMTGAGNSVKWVVLWNKLYKKELFEKLTFKEGKICEDEFIIHQLLFKCKKIIAIPNELYYYVQSPDSIIRSPYSIGRLDKVYALKERVDFFRAIKEKGLHDQAFKSYIESFLWNYFQAKTELQNAHRELKDLKKTFNSSWPTLMINPLIGWKQKVFLTFFIISPYLSELKFKHNKNL